MVKQLVAAAVLFCLPFLLSAETILLYMITETPNDDPEQYNDLIEDGVMNEFFDAGHIIFNISVSGIVPEVGLEHYTEPASMQMAKAGGASFLMEVKLFYSRIDGQKDGNELPANAGFQFYNVATGALLKEGSVNIDMMYIDRGDFEEGFSAMGKNMASYALSFLQGI